MARMKITAMVPMNSMIHPTGLPSSCHGSTSPPSPDSSGSAGSIGRPAPSSSKPSRQAALGFVESSIEVLSWLASCFKWQRAGLDTDSATVGHAPTIGSKYTKDDRPGFLRALWCVSFPRRRCQSRKPPSRTADAKLMKAQRRQPDSSLGCTSHCLRYLPWITRHGVEGYFSGFLFSSPDDTATISRRLRWLSRFLSGSHWSQLVALPTSLRLTRKASPQP